MSKGTMPPAGPNGEINASQAPDFIAVAGQGGGIAGYTPRRYLFSAPSQEPWPVYADDLRTLVGHMIAGKGFVPVGVDPATVPNKHVEAGPSLALPGRDTTVWQYWIQHFSRWSEKFPWSVWRRPVT